QADVPVTTALVCVLLVLASSCSRASNARVSELATDFGMRVFQEILQVNGDRNVLFSPYGMSSLMGMVQLGASGHTLEQLQDVMGYKLQEQGIPTAIRQLQKDITAKSNQDIVHSANAMFIQRNMTLTRGFVKSCRRAFHSRPKQVFFQNPKLATHIINKWVQAQTRDMIVDFLKPGMLNSGLTRMVLGNALYFKGVWKLPFPEEGTHVRAFHREDGSDVAVTMMMQTAQLNVGEFVSPGGVYYDVVELPYGDERLSMLLAAPCRRREPLSTITNILTSHLVTTWTQSMKRVTRQLVLPRFSLESETDLKASLREMGVTDMFDIGKANFAEISKTEGLFVSKALQKVRVEVNESGTKASSATAAILYARMAPLEVVLDRPFLFFIRHNPTGAVLFSGQVMEP
uniref:Plasminogen activator inhibitor 1 n=1 Tax=Callorhinchus milii TaxID=7868 RepID=A0A4W3JNC9_CALMI